jgi:DNA-binding transcriptional MerR regulator
MNAVIADTPSRDLQAFEPRPNALYSIESTARITHIPRRTILVYHKHGLIPSVFDPDLGYYFDDQAIQILRFIEYLRGDCGVNLPGVKMILQLTNELERTMG